MEKRFNVKNGISKSVGDRRITMELTEGKEYWVKARFLKKNEFYENPLFFDVNDAIDGLVMLSEDADLRETFPEHNEVKIQQFVADWIEGCWDHGYDLAKALDEGLNNSPKKVQDWLLYQKNQVTFARAWLDGYEIEKEPLGVLLVDIPENGYSKYNYLYKGESGKFSVNATDETDIFIKYAYKVTEAEAKEKYPNFKWVSLEELENDWSIGF